MLIKILRLAYSLVGDSLYHIQTKLEENISCNHTYIVGCKDNWSETIL